MKVHRACEQELSATSPARIDTLGRTVLEEQESSLFTWARRDRLRVEMRMRESATPCMRGQVSRMREASGNGFSVTFV